MEQRNDQFSQSETIGSSMGGERTPMEQMAETARATATQAAESFRRGEFITAAATDPNASADDRLIALLTYIVPFLFSFVVLLSESGKYRAFQRYHAVQSLALNCAFTTIAGLVLFTTLLALTLLAPLGVFFVILLLCMAPIAILMVIIALFYYGYQAYQGKRFAIPGLTAFLREQGWL